MHYWNVLIPIAFFWTGVVCAISFMEAWLKFQAPGVDTRTGLSIGRVVFNALNKVEWVMAVSLIVFLFMEREFKHQAILIFLAPVIILILQTVWLLPVLNHRIDMVLNEKPLPFSKIHVYYVIAEVIKVASLVYPGVKLLSWQG